jgi:transposase-like protein
MTKRKMFSAEFKREAVRLLEQGDKTSAQLARELGVKRNQLYKWQEEIKKHGAEAFPGHGRRQSPDSQAAENARLKQELARVKEENEILKKAAAFFAKELK